MGPRRKAEPREQFEPRLNLNMVAEVLGRDAERNQVEGSLAGGACLPPPFVSRRSIVEFDHAPQQAIRSRRRLIVAIRQLEARRRPVDRRRGVAASLSMPSC